MCKTKYVLWKSLRCVPEQNKRNKKHISTIIDHFKFYDGDLWDGRESRWHKNN